MDFNRIIVPIGNGKVLQLLMNIIPFLGVLFYDWSVFALIYAFWLETLSVSFFNAVRIIFAQKTNSPGVNILKGIKYLFVRSFILLFYMIFILVFIGIEISSTQHGVNFASDLLMLEPSFRITILVFFFIKLIELIYHYFYLNERKDESPDSYFALIDARLVIIHVVIVLGVFAFQFFSEKLDNHAGVVAFAGVFVLVKILGEMVSNWISTNKSESNKS